MPNPSRPWLRLWDCTLDLPKAQRLTGEQFKAWINLLMLANRQNDRGRLPDTSEIAFSLRLKESRIAPIIDVLVNAKLVDRIGSDLVMHDWQTWQPPEKTNAERAREWRDEQKDRALNERSPCAQDERSIGEESREEKKENAQIARKRAPKPPSIFLAGRPKDVPEREWADFHAVRKHKRALDNEGSLSHVLDQITKLRLDGQVIADCVRQSIRSNWTDVYAVKAYQNGYASKNGKPKATEPDITPEMQAKADRRIEEINRAQAERLAKLHQAKASQ